jgi:hypothetical protein
MIAPERLDDLCNMLGVAQAEERAAAKEDLAVILGDYSFAIQNDGPRVRNFADEADDVEKLAAQLASALEKFDESYFSVQHLLPFDSSARELSAASDDAIEALRALSGCAGAARGEIVARLGTGDADAPDRGGRGSVRTAREGNPKFRLASHLAGIFHSFRGEWPTATEDGEFHRFVLAAHQCVKPGKSVPFGRECKQAAKEYCEVRCFVDRVNERIEKHRGRAFIAGHNKNEARRRFYAERARRLMAWREIKLRELDPAYPAPIEPKP